jgi:hypothetical protein
MVLVSGILLLLIFGLGHPPRDPVDPAKGVALHSRLPCDGQGAPEDLLRVKASFSAGGAVREFAVSQYGTDKCSVETMFQCWHKRRDGWHDVWSVANVEASSRALVPVSSCNAWGSTEPAKYVLSGWYQGGSESKPVWKQVPVKQFSTLPEVYVFTDPNGGTARVEIAR